MAPCLVGKLVTEVEIKTNLDGHYKLYKHYQDLPKVLPQIYSSVKVIEGDGAQSGCVKEWGYACEGKSLTTVQEKTTYTDETMTICHCAVGGDMMNDYKKFHLILTVSPKANECGGILSLSIEYEKVNEYSPAPIAYLDLCQKIIEGMNSYLCSSE
ncbi:major latex protein 146-like [Papaver somniferum]|uniref:major latex protein 146-like n=1 Tax=Papaver somniferum TaxID=3469 RepID=UPI000E6F7ED1|nr:major latex protein 146-like [Papaver somniferum]